MKTDGNFQNLVSLSQEFSGPGWVQAAGGNVSFKHGQMITIKKSGLCFRDIHDENGFISLPLVYEDLVLLLREEKNPDLAQKVFDQRVADLVKGKNGRPSLELSFHLLGGAYVLHLHPTHINILGCSMEGQAFLADMEKGDPNLLCVPYVKPGLTLTAAIHAKLAEKRREKLPGVTVLFNHGLILSGDSVEEIKENLSEILSRIRVYVKQILPDEKYEKPFRGFLYPDAAVYCWDESRRNEEVWKNHSQVYHAIVERKWAPVFLSETEVSELLNWDAEKYRQQMVEK